MSGLESLRLAVAEREARTLATEQVWRMLQNRTRAERRRQLYREDPLWRLSKLKDNRERRLRAKVFG